MVSILVSSNLTVSTLAETTVTITSSHANIIGFLDEPLGLSHEPLARLDERRVAIGLRRCHSIRLANGGL